MKRFFYIGYYERDRLTGVAEIKEVINSHGFIVDFKMFSDVSISIEIEIEECRLKVLYLDLKRVMKMEDIQSVASLSKNDCTVLLNVTFIKGSGDFRRHVPAV